MSELIFGTTSALWLGILTSISPCPLATNIAAISYIGRRVGNARQVFLTGLLYALGRTIAYLGLAVLLLASVMSIPRVSLFLQKYMAKILGPVLIVVAMFLLDMVRVNLGGSGMSEKLQKHVDALGTWGALLLGVVFALTFCPVSAALFFGSLIPLSIKVNSSVALPSLYGIGTALPVLAFAVLLAVSAQSVGRAFNRLAQIEWWARRITGVVFLLIGIFYCLRYIYEVI
ncbi:MAG: aromatic aminobenezylarsenical efflux permease ArsG family transporter [Thermoguttaceae bacterium]